MKTLSQSLLLVIGVLAVAGAAYGQQPPDLVTSDSLANTAMGTNALLNVNLGEYGCHNTASGENTLYSDTSGSYNTATGFSSLFSNTTGNNNTAAGYESLYFNSSGSDNTANGYQALYTNTTGNDNTASGYQALFSDTTGSNNTASGYGALYSDTTGSNNTASGYGALYKNRTGTDNTASGTDALYANTSGHYNTASGYWALRSNTAGAYNTALGWQAGSNLTTGSNNIDIGNPGESSDGVAADSGVIRIGTQTPTALQTNTYIAGIYNNNSVTGLYVVVDSTGQLGVATAPPSQALKTAYTPEVRQEMQQQAAQIRDLKEQVAELKALSQATQVALRKLQAKDELVAQR